MTIHEFATRVLFSTTLEEKLTPPPADLTDERQPALERAPVLPGRPALLVPAESRERTHLPGLRELENDQGRGLLLHFFANHELLATELMALALLRFPDAPADFRRGLVRTLRDEQEHTRLYMQRMEQCGVAFGSHPVNSYFWRVVSDMDSPIDYVSRLSLTFEQANLDYARHFGGLFRQAGDEATGVLLDRIYRDEIGHVGYGLKWFRRWKDPSRTDWEEFSSRLSFPLSAARARGTGGTVFNAEGRLRAGLAPEFVESLRLYAHSRGRTPDVHFFNPAAEICAATGDAAPALTDPVTRTLAEDLDLLPLAVCHADDVVLLRRQPAPAHLRRLLDAGLHTAEFHLLERDGSLSAASPLRGRKLGRLRPWAWSADSLRTLEGLKELSGTGGPPPDAAAMKRLFSKAEMVPLIPAAHALVPGAPDVTLSAAAASEEEVLARMETSSALSPTGETVLKAPWSLAGRGMYLCGRTGPGLDARGQVWVQETLAAHGSVVVEPRLQRVADFSAQYEVDTPGALPRLRGLIRLHNDATGKFLACASAPAFTRLLPAEVARWNHTGWLADAPPQASVHFRNGLVSAIFSELLPSLLQNHLAGTQFSGWLGVDSFFHRAGNGQIALRPVCEINPRCTMGRVALELRRFADPAQTVTFRIFHRRRVQSQGFAGLVEFARMLEERYPVARGQTAGGNRILHGALPLNDPNAAREFLAVMHTGRPAADDPWFGF